MSSIILKNRAFRLSVFVVCLVCSLVLFSIGSQTLALGTYTLTNPPDGMFSPVQFPAYVAGRGSRINCSFFTTASQTVVQDQQSKGQWSQDPRCTNPTYTSVFNGTVDVGFREDQEASMTLVALYTPVPVSGNSVAVRFQIESPGVCSAGNTFKDETANEASRTLNFPSGFSDNSKSYDRFSYSADTGFQGLAYRSRRSVTRINNAYSQLVVNYSLITHNSKSDPTVNQTFWDTDALKTVCGVQSVNINILRSRLSASDIFKIDGVDHYRLLLQATTTLTRGAVPNADRNNANTFQDLQVYNSFRILPAASAPDVKAAPYTTFRGPLKTRKVMQMTNFKKNGNSWGATLPFAILNNNTTAEINLIDMDGGAWNGSSYVRTGQDIKLHLRQMECVPGSPGQIREISGDIRTWDTLAELGTDANRYLTKNPTLNRGIYSVVVESADNSNNLGIQLPDYENISASLCPGTPVTINLSGSCPTGQLNFSGTYNDPDAPGSTIANLRLIQESGASLSGFARTNNNGSYTWSKGGVANGTYRFRTEVTDVLPDGSVGSWVPSNSVTVNCSGGGGGASGAFTMTCGTISTDFGELEPNQTITNFQLKPSIHNGTLQTINGSVQITFDANGPPGGMASPTSFAINNLAAGTDFSSYLTYLSVAAPINLRTITLTFVGALPAAPVGNPHKTTVSCPLYAKTRTYFRVQGGDAAVGQSIYTFGRSDTASEYYGSGSDFAVFADGDIDGSLGDSNREAFFSRMVSVRNNRDISRSLMFANTSPSPPLGGQFGGVVAISPPNTTTGYTVRDCPGGGVFAGLTVSTGEKVVYNCAGNVFITNPINYSYLANTPLEEIPSLVIVADNIFVAPGVNVLNGQYFATGIFSTCSEAVDSNPSFANAAQTSGRCAGQLTIFGSVMAGQFQLRRTGGTIQDAPANESGNAAERFVFSPELFSGAASPGNTSAIYYEDLTNLPPIY